ncbi:hypothetical protein THAOC_37100 [Thalassiosira oceanica]|uniref:DUF6820 domain-containing protein n=1 Tax=Thalassiosira oceanica TaxID=159749 RepID=K0QZ71_THAOC|nr:hypothetical protein THAOC_37100 [Thalassiosira oceanica]|eukprot:EJK44365.1 hypothetical protein THAOC_37100 [Thalassiosira oceanica]
MASLGRGELLHNHEPASVLRQTAVGNIESKLIDEVIPAAASSDLQIRTWTGGQPTEVRRRGAAEEPNTDIGISGQKEVNDVINGPGTSAGRARLMMREFAVATARLIDNGGRRAIGIALRPQHFKGDVLGMNRCHGRRHRATRLYLALLLTTISYFEGVGEVLRYARDAR